MADRVFKRDWLITVGLPSLPAFAALVLIATMTIALLLHSRYAAWLAILAVLPLVRMAQLHLTWVAYSVSIASGTHTLIETEGIIEVSERCIPLTRLISVRSVSPWWATLFNIDVGDATIEGVIGEKVTLRRIGQFSDLWVLLQTSLMIP